VVDHLFLVVSYFKHINVPTKATDIPPIKTVSNAFFWPKYRFESAMIPVPRLHASKKDTKAMRLWPEI
jgi:hypothetical protein